MANLPPQRGRTNITDLPAELLIELMKNMPTPSTLRDFISGYPWVRDLYRKYHAEILVPVLRAAMPQELQQLLIATMSVQAFRFQRLTHIDRFYRRHLETREAMCPVAFVRAFIPPSLCPLFALHRLANVCADIDSAVGSFVQARLIRPSSMEGMAHEPATRTELHRVHRAFWRVKLYCELFHRIDRLVADLQRSATADPAAFFRVSRQARDGGADGLRAFLSHFCDWECDELEAVRNHLCAERRRLDAFRHSAGTAAAADRIVPRELKFVHRLLDRLPGPGSHVDPHEDLPFGRNLGNRIWVFSSRAAPLIQWRDACSRTARANTSVAQAKRLQAGQAQRSCFLQWGWCMWDRARLRRCGLLGSGAEAGSDAHGRALDAQGLPSFAMPF